MPSPLGTATPERAEASVISNAMVALRYLMAPRTYKLRKHLMYMQGVLLIATTSRQQPVPSVRPPSRFRTPLLCGARLRTHKNYTGSDKNRRDYVRFGLRELNSAFRFPSVGFGFGPGFEPASASASVLSSSSPDSWL